LSTRPPDAGFRVEELEEALKKGSPEIFNAGQGALFTVRPLPSSYSSTELESVWMGKGAITTTYSSRG
jgi:hypothetical protein